MPRLFETAGATGCTTEVDAASAGASLPGSAACADPAEMSVTPITTEQPASGTARFQRCLRDSLCISVILGMGAPPQNSPPRALGAGEDYQRSNRIATSQRYPLNK